MSEALATAGQMYEISGQIDRFIEDINTSTYELGVKQVKLASALLKVQVGEYWRGLGFRSWNEYLKSVRDKLNRGRTQLYAYVQVAATLLPALGEENVEKMGITKGLILTRGMRLTNCFPSDELIEKYATDKEYTAEEFEEKMNEEFKIHLPAGKSKWFQLEGFYLDEEEKLEVLEAFSVAMKTDPTTSTTVSKSAQTKDVVLKWAREYIGTYAELAERGEA